MLAVAAGGAGCSGGSDPAPAPATHQVGTAPSSTAPSATATTTSAAERKAAAIAAVQRLYAEYNAMLKSGSSKAYRQTFTSACTYCSQDADLIDRITRMKRRIRGGSIKVSRLHATTANSRLVIVDGDLRDSAADVLFGDKVVDHYAGGSTDRVTWQASESHGVWVVTDEEALIK